LPRLDREALRQRMEKHLESGEALLAWGWASYGFLNVLMAATDRRLILETIGFTCRTREMESLDYSRLEAVAAGAGDSTIPGWAKINIENAVMSAMTTHLVVKPLGDAPRHYLFRPFPFYPENKAAGLELGQAVRSVRPSLPGEEALKGFRRASSGRATWWKWGGAGGGVIGLLLAILTTSWEGAIAGLILGLFLGAVLAIGWNAVRTIASGRG
jgi:hypothetical protein